MSSIQTIFGVVPEEEDKRVVPVVEQFDAIAKRLQELADEREALARQSPQETTKAAVALSQGFLEAFSIYGDKFWYLAEGESVTPDRPYIGEA